MRMRRNHLYNLMFVGKEPGLFRHGRSLPMVRIASFVICLLGVILPHSLRVLYTEILGWIAQAFYFVSQMIIETFVREPRRARMERDRIRGEQVK